MSRGEDAGPGLKFPGMNEADLERLLGLRIQALRQRSRLTQEELAERVDLTVGTISNIERGARRTRLSTAAALASALGVSLPELFEFAEVSSTRTRRRAIAEINQALEMQDDETFKITLGLIQSALALQTGRR